jgi:hypothetical protein
MTNTMTFISSVTVGSGGASSINLTSIPSTYTDLILKISFRNTNAGSPNGDSTLQFNSDTANNYAVNTLYSTGSSMVSNIFSSSQEDIRPNGGNSTANTFANVEIYIPNYAGSKTKSFSVDLVVENNATSNFMNLDAGLWSSTAAITSIQINAGTYSQTLAQYSTAYLYGVKNA